MAELKYDEIADGNEVRLRLPDGRLLHLWYHDCDHCTSVDVWTNTEDDASHAVSAGTGDTTRAPLGVMSITGGSKNWVDTGRAPTPTTKGYPEAATAILVWNDTTDTIEREQ